MTELKSWPIIRTFQKRVDVYFHLLSRRDGAREEDEVAAALAKSRAAAAAGEDD